MPADEIRRALETLQSSFRETLDTHLDRLSREHEDVLAAVRREAAAEAAEAARQEWAQRLEADVEAARAEGERRIAAETARLTAEAQQAAADAAARLRGELEQEIAAERARADAQLRAEREHAARELEAERERARAELDAARDRAAAADADRAALTDARGVEREAQLAGVERLLGAVQAITAERTLNGILDRLLEHAAASASRAVLFVVDGDRVRGMRASGFDDLDPARIDLPIDDAGVLRDAVRAGEARATGGSAPPRGIALSEGRAGFAAPLLVGGHVVALVYADDGTSAQPPAPAAWPEAIELLARHASSALALVTATRTLQALGGAPAGSAEADDQSARRYARLLVSEIKLYNESAVRVGREKRDLLERLAPEIARARRLYEERVPPAIGGRGQYFQQELVQTLADGDPALLGHT